MADQAHGRVKVNSNAADPWSPFSVADPTMPTGHTGKAQEAGDTMSVGTTEIPVSEDTWSNTATAGGENINER